MAGEMLPDETDDDGFCMMASPSWVTVMGQWSLGSERFGMLRWSVFTSFPIRDLLARWLHA
ncbi:MAG: hypothetical protein AAB308_06960, partial [Nitrospirota bacterium]